MFQTRQHLRYEPIIFCVFVCCFFPVFEVLFSRCFYFLFFFFYKQKPAVTNKEKPEKSLYPAGYALQIPPAKIVTNFSASTIISEKLNGLFKVSTDEQMVFFWFVCLNYLFI